MGGAARVPSPALAVERIALRWPLAAWVAVLSGSVTAWSFPSMATVTGWFIVVCTPGAAEVGARLAVLVARLAGAALAVIGVVTSVVGAYYYLRIVKIMYMDEPAAAFLPMPQGLRVVLGITGLLIILFFAYPAPLVAAAAAAAKSLF
jgi:hypothetical protein